MTVEEVFAKIPEKVAENREQFEGIAGNFRFVVGEETWCVKLPEGTVEKGCGSGDVTVTLSPENFLALVSGKLNPVTAYMMGKIRVSGRMDLAMQLANVLKALA